MAHATGCFATTVKGDGIIVEYESPGMTAPALRVPVMSRSRFRTMRKLSAATYTEIALSLVPIANAPDWVKTLWVEQELKARGLWSDDIFELVRPFLVTGHKKDDDSKAQARPPIPAPPAAKRPKQAPSLVEYSRPLGPASTSDLPVDEPPQSALPGNDVPRALHADHSNESDTEPPAVSDEQAQDAPGQSVRDDSDVEDALAAASMMHMLTMSTRWPEEQPIGTDAGEAVPAPSAVDEAVVEGRGPAKFIEATLIPHVEEPLPADVARTVNEADSAGPARQPPAIQPEAASLPDALRDGTRGTPTLLQDDNSLPAIPESASPMPSPGHEAVHAPAPVPVAAQAVVEGVQRRQSESSGSATRRQNSRSKGKRLVTTTVETGKAAAGRATPPRRKSPSKPEPSAAVAAPVKTAKAGRAGVHSAGSKSHVPATPRQSAKTAPARPVEAKKPADATTGGLKRKAASGAVKKAAIAAIPSRPRLVKTAAKPGRDTAASQKPRTQALRRVRRSSRKPGRRADPLAQSAVVTPAEQSCPEAQAPEVKATQWEFTVSAMDQARDASKGTQYEHIWDRAAELSEKIRRQVGRRSA